MNVLFCLDAKGPDYQCDSLLHGMANMTDINLDVCALSPLREITWRLRRKSNPLWYLKSGVDPQILRQLYGRGFTLYGRITHCGHQVSVCDAVTSMIAGKYDLVVVGSVWRCSWVVGLAQSFCPSKLIVVDGEDHQNVHPVANKCHRYFKRELSSSIEGAIRPISFAIPEELIVAQVCKKRGRLAPIIPGDFTTYIYDNETDYYRSYEQHTFGLTMKKSGWDCLRHYEISMNGCLPLMRDIDDCPPNTMVSFPKTLCRRVIEIFDNGTDDDSNELANEMLEHTRLCNTTRSLATYVISDAIYQ